MRRVRGADRFGRGSDVVPPTWLVVGVAAVTVLLSAAAAGPRPLPGDPEVARFLQRVPDPPGGAIARLADLTGGLAAVVGIGLAVAIVLAVAGRLALAGLLLAALGFRAVNPALKAIVDSPRPTPQIVRVAEVATGLGFPSGHAMGIVLLWGTVAYLANHLIECPVPRRVVQVLALMLVLVTGFGRVYSGAHWPSDVVGGYLWGATIILVLVWAQTGGRVASRTTEEGDRR